MSLCHFKTKPRSGTFQYSYICFICLIFVLSYPAEVQFILRTRRECTVLKRQITNSMTKSETTNTTTSACMKTKNVTTL